MSILVQPPRLSIQYNPSKTVIKFYCTPILSFTIEYRFVKNDVI